VRINKYISQSGLCSRREADSYVEQGKVRLNGKVAKKGDQVLPGDEVRVAGKHIRPKNNESFVFVALNKPRGIVCTTDNREPNNIIEFIKHPTRIFPIGRLDKDSQGLIFLTSNGDLVNKILRAGNKHEKEYVVTVNKPISESFIQGMSTGVPILDTITKKCVVKKQSRFVFTIVLIQGLNRQIRRMCEHFGYRVKKLERTRIMHIRLDNLKLGEWRDLNKREMRTMLNAVQHSSSETQYQRVESGLTTTKSKTISRKRSANDKQITINRSKRNESKGGNNPSTSKPKSRKRTTQKRP